MRHFKHIFIILFVLTSCSTEMDSDLETAINNGYVSESYNDLPGTLYTGDNSTTTADNTTTYLYNFEDGVVPSNFSMSGNADWGVTSSTYSSGSYSLKSGSIVHSQTSCVSLTQTTLVGFYSFHYKTSSDSTDYLKFYIDNSAIIAASGSSSSSFTKYSGTVSSAGSHTFKWCYEKDSATSEGSDTVWIDEILMPLEAKTFSSVSAGESHTCATDNSSTAKCWGRGSNGQLGYSSSGTSTQYTPVLVSGISTATAVSAGESHTCAVLSGGTVKCWGYGYYGQLGYSSSGTSNQYTPVTVEPVFLDQSGPTGSFAINNKSSYSTGYKTVSFTLTAADSTAIVGYYLSTSSSTPSSSSSAWTSVSETTSLSVTVTSSKYLPSGNIYFYVWYKDVLKNISAQYTDSMYCSSSSCY